VRVPQRLSTRLTVWFLALFVATIGVVVGLTLFFANRAFQTSVDDQLLGLAHTAEERINSSDDDQHILEELSTAAQFLELVDAHGNVTLLSGNLDGKPLPTFIRRGQPLNDGLHTIGFRKAELRIVRHALLDENGAVTGYVVVGGVVPDVNKNLRDLAFIIAGASVIGLVGGVGGTILVARRESGPLKELTDLALATAASGFDQPVPPSTRGSKEARELRRAFSVLVDRQRQVLERERAFFADSSHVLRTPLAVLQGDIEMLEQGIYGKERQEVVVQARTAIDAMSRTLSGLLLLAREQDGAGTSWEVVELRALLRVLTDEAKTAFPELSVALEEGEEVEVAGDPHQLRDLFASLVENACHYTPASGSVRVGLARDDDTDAVVEVRDTGIGLTEQESSQATERFFRGQQAKRMFPGGSGLGLAIAARIASVHNGSLVIEKGEPQGAVARVRLPLLG